MSRTVRIHRHGGPEVLEIEHVDVPPPPADEVTVEVKAIGLNRSEAQFRSGRHLESVSLPARLGYEAAGIVSAVGAQVVDLVPGDHVGVLTSSVTQWGTYGEVVNVPSAFAVPSPPTLSWTEAASIWMQNVTAYGGLIELGELQPQETVVVVAASSSVGLAAIQVANAVGAVVVATTRSSAKEKALLDAGADHVVVTDEQDLVERVLAITEGRGARLIFDPVGGPDIERLMAVASYQGTLIAYGVMSEGTTPLPLFPAIGKGLTIRGFTFKEIIRDPERRSRARDHVLAGLGDGSLRARIDRTFDLDEIVDAHRYLEANTQFGKIVVTV